MRLNKVAGIAASTLFSGALVLGLSTTAAAAPDLGSLSDFGSAAAPQVKPGGECEVNYLPKTDKWEINWGMQYTDQGKKWQSSDFGGLTYIDPQYPGKTPEQELAAIDGAGGGYQWYPSRAMVNKGTTMSMDFADGDNIQGQVAVGTDFCPAVKWTHTKDGEVVETITPDTFPAEPTGLLGSLANFIGNLS